MTHRLLIPSLAAALLLAAAPAHSQGQGRAQGQSQAPSRAQPQTQGQAQPGAKMDRASQKFIKEAIEGNFAEVEMGKLAQQNGQSVGVKQFGTMLVTDHSAANQKATLAAQQISVTPPDGPNAKQKADQDRMAKMKGAAFDRMFAQHMVADHKKDIAEYQKEAKKQDAAGQYAKAALPTLQKHLETAQSLQKDSGRGGRAAR